MDCTKTLQLRIKDKHARVLRQMAREVNQVWNHINAISAKAARPFHGKPQFLSGYDLQKFTAGFSKCDGVSVGSGTVQLVCVEYATRRKQFKKTRLNWRVSNPKSAKYSLGWIPFKGGHAKYKAGQIHFAGQKLSLWDSYGLMDYELRAGSFSQDSRGRWYFNVAVQVQSKPSPGTAAVGIDLGLKECATASNEQKLPGRWYHQHELALAKAQRANKKKRVKTIHAKIKNQRKDDMHQFSSKLVQENAAIFVGNVASSGLLTLARRACISPLFEPIIPLWIASKPSNCASKTSTPKCCVRWHAKSIRSGTISTPPRPKRRALLTAIWPVASWSKPKWPKAR